MAISFSGLASGLDTSSWVESLTALKRAKVTTLQEKKEVTALSLNTLNSIKSFFSSFRSLLEKVTDTRFNIATMDVFAKNIATSTNAKVLSALATTEAEEGKYEIDVKKLASNTQATSKYTYETQIVTTTKATNDTLLKHIGVSAGEITVNVDGSNRTVVIGEYDTIGTFAQKMKLAGVDANFNEKTGVFSMNINASDITDDDNTGIVDCLHLSDVNKGFLSNEITKEQTELVTALADENTKLSDLGVRAGTFIIESNGYEYDVTLDDDDTVQDLIIALGNETITASINNGVFRIEDAEITNVGTTNIINALGLTSPDPNSTIQKSEGLIYTVNESTTANVDLDTLLKDINTTAVASGTLILEDESEGTTKTINVDESTTLGGLINSINTSGLSVTATLKADGTFSITSEDVVIKDTSTYDLESVLGLTETSDRATYTVQSSNTLYANVEGTEQVIDITKTIVSTETITVTNTVAATGSTEIGQLVNSSCFERNYTITGTLNADGTITGGNVVGISTEAELKAMATAAADNPTLYSGCTFVLQNDISLSATEWQGINIAEATFDGQGHNIELDISNTGTYCALFFNANNSNIYDLSTSGTVQAAYAAGIAEQFSGIMLNCSSSAEVIGQSIGGGLIGEFNQNANRISGCSFSGEVTGATAGGIIAGSYWQGDNSNRIENCVVSGTIKALGSGNVGGIAGQIPGFVYVENCLFSGTLIALETATTGYIGGLTGVGNSNIYNNCINTATFVDNTGTSMSCDAFSPSIDGAFFTNCFYTDSSFTTAVPSGATLSTNLETDTAGLGFASQWDFNGNVATLTPPKAAVVELWESGSLYANFVVTENTTLLELMYNQFDYYGFQSTLENGELTVASDYFVLKGAVAEALGIANQSSVTVTYSETTTESSIQRTESVQVTPTTITVGGSTTTAGLSTTLADLGLESGGTLEINDGSGIIATITLSGTDSLQTMKERLATYSIEMTMTNGTMSFNNNGTGMVVDGGTIADKFEIEVNRVLTGTPSTQLSSNLVCNVETTASASTTLAQLGCNSASQRVWSIYSKDGSSLVATGTAAASDTLQNVFDTWAAHGVNATITNGTININSTSGYVTGNLADALHIESTSSSGTAIIGSNTTSSAQITYTTVKTTTSTSSSEQTVTACQSTTKTGTVFVTTTVASSMPASNAVGFINQIEVIDTSTIASLSTILDYEGGGLAHGTYKISTTEEFIDFVTYGTNYGFFSSTEHTEIILADNIDLTNDAVSYSFESMVLNANITLNGNGYAITNVHGDYLIARIGESATIKNLAVVYSETPNSFYQDGCGLLVLMQNRGTIENCSVISDLNINNATVAGIAGTNTGTIKDCYVGVSLSSSSSSVDDTFNVITNSNTGNTSGCLYEAFIDSSFAGSLDANGATGSRIDYVSNIEFGDYATLYTPLNGVQLNTITRDITLAELGYSDSNPLMIVFDANAGYSIVLDDPTDINATYYLKDDEVAEVTTGTGGDTFYTGENITGIVFDDSSVTLGDVLDMISACAATKNGTTVNFSATIEDGEIVINSPNGVTLDLSADPLGDGTAKTLAEIGATNTYTEQEVVENITTTTTTTTTQTLTATEDVKLSQLGISSNQTYVVNRDGVESTITVGSTMTLGQLVSNLQSNGVNATFADGKITIDDSDGSYLVSMSSALQSALKLPTLENVSQNVTNYSNNSTAQVNVTLPASVTTSTTFEQLGFDGNSTAIIKDASLSEIATITMQKTQTLGDFINALSAYGITATLEDGKLSLTTPTNFVSGGTIADEFGIEASSAANMVIQTSSISLGASSLITATGSTTLAQLGYDSGLSIRISDKNGSIITSYTASAGSSLNSIFSTLDTNYGISASIDSNGVITFDNSETGNYISGGTFATEFGISSTPIEVTYNNQTSSTPLIDSTGQVVTADTKLSDIVDLTDVMVTVYTAGSEATPAPWNLYVAFATGAHGSHTNINEATIGDLQAWLTNLGFQTSLSNEGVISIQGSTVVGERTAVSGSIFEQMGITLETSTATTTTANDFTSGTLYYTQVEYATGSTKLTDLIVSEELNLGTINADGTITGGTVVMITSEADLQAMNNKTYEGIHFILNNDVTLTSDAWEGISLTNSTFDGNGYEINLNLADGYALFFRVNNSTIKQLTTSGSIESNDAYVSGLAFQVSNGSSIENCNSTATITGPNVVSGLVGWLDSSSLTNSSFDGTFDIVSADLHYIGGLVGVAYNSSIRNNQVYGEISVSGGNITYIGGILYDTTGGNSIQHNVFNADINVSSNVTHTDFAGLIYTKSNSSSDRIEDNIIHVKSNNIQSSYGVSGLIGSINSAPTSVEGFNNYYTGFEDAPLCGATTLDSSLGGYVDDSQLVSKLSEIGGFEKSGDTISISNCGVTAIPSNQIYIKSNDGTIVGTITVQESETLDSLCAQLNAQGVVASYTNGILSLDNTNGCYAEGAILDKLGVSFNVTTTTNSIDVTTTVTTIGQTMSSTSEIAVYVPTTIGTTMTGSVVEITTALTSETKLSAIFGYDSMGYSIEGVNIGYNTVNKDGTLGDLLDVIEGRLSEPTFIDYSDGHVYFDDLLGQESGSVIIRAINTSKLLAESEYGCFYNSQGIILGTNRLTLPNIETRAGVQNLSSSSAITYTTYTTTTQAVTLESKIFNIYDNLYRDTVIDGISRGDEFTFCIGDVAQQYYGNQMNFSLVTLQDVFNYIELTTNSDVEASYVEVSTAGIVYLLGSGIQSLYIDGNDVTAGPLTEKIVAPSGVGTASMGTTFGALGIVSNKYITIMKNGTEKVVTVTADTTIYQLGNTLKNNCGITSNISNGTLTLTGTETSYIKGMDTELAEVLNLPTSQVAYNQPFHGEVVNSLSESTTIGELIPDYVSSNQPAWIVNNNGKLVSITVASTATTVGQICDQFEAAGMTAYVEDGKLILEGKQDVYIADCNYAGVAGILGHNYPVTSYDYYTVETVASSTCAITCTAPITTSSSTTITGANSLAELGMDSNGYIVLHNIANDTYHTTTVNYTQGVLNALNSATSSISSGQYLVSLTNGVIKFNMHNNPNWEVTEVSDNLAEALNLNSTSTYAFNERTMLKELGLGVGTVMGITVHSNGTSHYTILNPEQTVGDLCTWFASKGINAEVVNGKLTLTPTEGSYIVAMHSEIKNVLKLTGQNSFTTVEEEIANPSQDIVVTQTVTKGNNAYFVDESEELVSESTKLGDLGATGGVLTFSDGTTFDYTDVDDLSVDDLYNINGHDFLTVNNGVITIDQSDDFYLVSDSGNLLSKLGFDIANSYSETEVTVYSNTASNPLGVAKPATVTTTLGQIEGYTNGSLSITKGDGSVYTLTSNSSSTFAELFSELESQGVYATLTADGTLSVSSASDVTLNGFSSVFNLTVNNADTTRTVGYENTSSSPIVKSGTVSLTTSTKLGDIDGFSAGNLTITDANGTYTVTCGANNTLADLFAEISTKGVNASIKSNGKIELNYSSNITLGGFDSLFKLGAQEVIPAASSATNSDSKQLTVTNYSETTADTTLGNLRDSEGNPLDNFVINYNNGEKYFTFTADDSIQDILDTLETGTGLDFTLNPDGSITYTGGSENKNYFAPSPDAALNEALFGNATITGSGSNTQIYTAQLGTVESGEPVEYKLSDESLLKDMDITSGNYYIFENGVKNTVYLSVKDDTTLADFRATLGTFNITTTYATSAVDGTVSLVLTGVGKSGVASAAGGSNIVNVLFPRGMDLDYNYEVTLQISETSTVPVNITESDLISDFNKVVDGMTMKSEGTLALLVDGELKSVTITADDTFGSLADKLSDVGIEAGIRDNKFFMNVIDKEVSVDSSTSSNLISNLGLTLSENIGGVAASTIVCEETKTTIETRTASVANYADYDTKLSLLNITSGSFSVYRDGEKALIQVDSEETFGELRSRIATAFGDVDLVFEDGYMKLVSTTENIDVQAGATTDTSNLTAVVGLRHFGNEMTSARELYKVNGNSTLVNAGLFAKGNVAEGTFVVGNATFEIKNDTTLNDIIKQINSSDESGATAFWDAVDGKLTLKSKITGNSMLNIEAGTSNFTDILGYTESERDASGNIVSTKLVVESQQMGGNAEFTINGTDYTSTSNTITSDISKIKGVTIYLKDISQGEPVTLTIEKDKESVATAMEDIITGYNELITNVDKELASTGNLHDQTSLKIIRNSIRNLMTNATGNPIFRNLDAVGISLNKASTTNLKTEGIDLLSFDREKFIAAYDKDSEALKEMLTGNMGVLTRVEAVVEQALASASGYFASAENSYRNQITRLDRQIERANVAVSNYKSRLESKFAAMEKIISGMRDQYSSFLGT